MIRIVVVDDEPPARDRLLNLIAGHSDVQVVGVAACGAEAIEILTRTAPDAVFLDIRMPDMDGFRVLEHLPATCTPLLVFVTAHDDFAVVAFEANALDYLMKPVEEARFASCVERIRAALARGSATHQGGIAAALPGILPLERIAVKTGDRVRVMPVTRINWIEAVGTYVRIHADGCAHIMRVSMNELEQRLNPRDFVRVHRSTIVPVARIQELHEYARGEYRVRLTDGTEHKVSRGRRVDLEQRIGHIG